jgi:multidrug/hemolysin transport system ATP-binding protein
MAEILSVKHLSKSFGQLKAVDDLSFNVESGKLFAFLGQNGAGKSTTINMLIGTLERDGGEIVYAGDQTFTRFKEKIGVVFQNNILDNFLTVEENIKLYGRLYAENNERIKNRYEELAKLFEFKEFEKKKFKTLSGGQKRRVEVARALFNTPEILFLDEPTTGLDPKTRIDVWRVINKIRRDTGMTVFLTTHYMEETADADEVVIIHNGKKIAEGTPSLLKEKYSADKIKIVPKNEEKFVSLLGDMPYTKIADQFEFLSKNADEEIEFLSKMKDQIKLFEVVKGSMDDVFLNAVGQTIRGEVK